MSRFQDCLKKYLEVFHDQEMYFTDDTRNLELFRNTPGNTSIEDVRIKVSAIDDPEFNRLAAVQEMAAHIVKLNIDGRIAKGDLAVVEDIAGVTIHGQPQRLLGFASRYCNFHRPDVFPIYSHQYLNFYKHYIIDHHLDLNPDELDRYAVFSAVLTDLIGRWGQKGKMNFLQARKFAWIYAGKVVEEADPKTMP